ncbi:MAG: MBL fold metallo-hydrolase [Candidatus Omnitrophica bacterium]|nr:MBL fold metallo-hydrolase [Candidatus Omnitrophota bacterium]
MNIKVVFNSDRIKEDFSIGWGLSLLLDDKILFDTGESAKSLINNMNKMEIDISLIEAVVISHDHWDHTGGLWEILKQRPNINVYGCPGFGVAFKDKISDISAKLIEDDNFTLVTSGIYSTGEIIGEYKGEDISEQALIIKTDKGFSVITGCAHPGIIKILERVRMQLSLKEFYTVLGGFHLKDYSIKDVKEIVKKFTELKVMRVGPTHCSGSDAEQIFQEKYGNAFIEAKVGQVISV